VALIFGDIINEELESITKGAWGIFWEVGNSFANVISI